MHMHSGETLIAGTDLGHIGEVKLWIDALGEHVHGEGYYINIAGTLTVAEESTLYSVCTGQKSHLCVAYAAASVVMRMKA